MDAGCRAPRKESAQTGIKQQIPANLAIGAAAQCLAAAGMICNDIMPCAPLIDLGFDTLSCAYGSRFCRVQIRGQRSCRDRGQIFRFSLLRRKTGISRDGEYLTSPERRFSPDDIDAFVFVHIVYMRFFIVPASDIDWTKSRIVLRPGDEWENAWHHLKT